MNSEGAAERGSLAAQVTGLASFGLALFLVFVTAYFVLPSLASITAGVVWRLVLLPFVLGGSVVGGFLAFRWQARADAGNPVRWLLLGLPGLAFFAAYIQVFTSGFERPYHLFELSVDVAGAGFALVAIVGSLVAFAEARRGSAVWPPVGSRRTGSLATAAILAVVAVLVVATSAIATAVQPQRLGPHGNGPAPSPQASGVVQFNPNAQDATVTSVAKGTVAALPDGTLYINVADLTARPPVTEPGIEFDPSSGSGVMTDGTKPVPAKGIFFSVRLTSARSAATGSIYATDDLPPLPRINQTEALNLVKLGAHGRSATLKAHGVELIYAVGGTVNVQAGTIPGGKTLARGQGVFVLDNTGVQVINPGSSPVSYLAFFLAPDPNNLESA